MIGQQAFMSTNGYDLGHVEGVAKELFDIVFVTASRQEIGGHERA